MGNVGSVRDLSRCTVSKLCCTVLVRVRVSFPSHLQIARAGFRNGAGSFGSGIKCVTA